MFSCIIAVRTSFESLVISYFASRFKRRQHAENITRGNELPIQSLNIHDNTLQDIF